MLRGGRSSNRTPLSWSCADHQVGLLLFMSWTSLSKNIYPLPCPSECFTASCGRPSAPLHICHCSHLPAHAHPVLFASRPCSSHTPTPCLSLLAPTILPASYPCRRVRCPSLLVLVVPLRALGRSPAKPRAPMSAGHARGARASRPQSTDPDLPSHMLQMYVSSVSDVSEVCCRCFVWMLQK